MTERKHDEVNQPVGRDEDSRYVVNQLLNLYLGRKIAGCLGSYGQEQGEGVWNKAVIDHEKYGAVIRRLKRSLEAADAAKEAYPQLTPSGYFYKVEDELARALLADLLLARMSITPGYIDSNKNPAEEAVAIVGELDAGSSLGGDELKQISLETVISKILTGDLGLEYRPQPEIE